jgi:hypothetical protein
MNNPDFCAVSLPQKSHRGEVNGRRIGYWTADLNVLSYFKLVEDMDELSSHSSRRKNRIVN